MELVQILSITISIGILIFVIELIRRDALKEKYALLWLFSSLVLFLFSVWRGLLDTVAVFFGFYYSPSFLFLMAFGFLLLITLHFSVVISTMSEKNKKLAQDLGIMREELDRIKKAGSVAKEEQ